MSWLIRNDSNIEHIDHAWAPQEQGWEMATRFFLDKVKIMVKASLAGEPIVGTTIKVDDRVSFKIRKLQGCDVEVGYKGNTSPWVSNQFDLATYYGDKPYKSALEKLLRLGHGLFPRDVYPGIMYQVGIMSEDAITLPATITPNVIPYFIKEAELTSYKMVISLVRKMFVFPDGKTHSAELDDYDYASTGDILIYDNRVSKIRVDDELLGAIYHAESALKNCIGSGFPTWNLDRVTRYLNREFQRSGVFRPTPFGLIGFTDLDAQAKADKVKLDTTKRKVLDAAQFEVKHIVDDLTSNINAFELVKCIEQICRIITVNLDFWGEGLVIVGNEYLDCQKVLKIVDRQFTQENTAKWSITQTR